ncbi:hypothetical protein KKJ06_12820 [Xenorhabdus bovienii]|uniref:phosphopantetheine-binding protein n=1 Tax=Xenorhabdus bovienii TaxID=40576 RepID=UPI0023B297F3|nr:phosphopantetheine-binding protein [Xenorhabdus bovienii]MDE9482413.1 hypothetical protein [Xenorhabdus bovienii]MDE9556289.1 hypothetical protein [Xenorhabdus bovienii]
MMKVASFVEGALIRACRNSVDNIAEDTSFFNDLGLDSIDFINVVYEIDSHYGIKIPIGQWMSEVNEGEANMSKYFVMGNFVDAVNRLVEEKVS